MLSRHSIRTTAREQWLDITSQVQEAVRQMGLHDGLVTVFVPHTTAAVTINENADPSVVQDILYALDKAAPQDRHFHHLEGNSTAHIKSSIIGPSLQLIVENGQLVLGTWQGIFFCEFDGPRQRKFLVKGLAGQD